jgi:hypothetical protein
VEHESEDARLRLFERIAADFPIALRAVRIARVEERAPMEDWKI